ncbi:MAG: hypothetical protein ACK56I_35165 [bacterium]
MHRAFDHGLVSVTTVSWQGHPGGSSSGLMPPLQHAVAHGLVAGHVLIADRPRAI